MAILQRILNNRIIQNIFAWGLVYVILLALVNIPNRPRIALFIMGCVIPPIYVNNLLILPLLKRRKFLFWLFFILNILFWSSLYSYILTQVFFNPIGPAIFTNTLGMVVFSVTIGMLTKIAWTAISRSREQREAELKLLKAQLDPHFLFNTLNNLYGLSVTKSEKLPGLMLKLSELLRYTLYETKGNWVPLEKEVEYLKNYISLEQIRLEDQVEIDLNGELGPTEDRIAPLILIVFLENAFKHLAQGRDGKTEVRVSLDHQPGKLSFSCVNTYDPGLVVREQNAKGIGLENVRKRLALIYPKRHKLLIEPGEDRYHVKLELQL